MIRGFDASSVQGIIPFDKLPPDLRFGIFKGQQGNDHFDPNFKRNVRGALLAGIEPFAYAFAYPLPDNGNVSRGPEEQARMFVDRTLAANVCLHGRPLFLDYEWPEPGQWKRWGCSAAQINEWCRRNAAEVKAYSGVTPIIYTYPHWWAAISKGTDVSWAADYPLWIASYPGNGWPAVSAKPYLPKPWTDWLFWQFDGNGGLKFPNGVDADFCVFNGDEDALKVLACRKRRPVGDGVLGDAAIDELTRR
jgi:lysozyme